MERRIPMMLGLRTNFSSLLRLSAVLCMSLPGLALGIRAPEVERIPRVRHDQTPFASDLKGALARLQQDLLKGFQSPEKSPLDGLVSMQMAVLATAEPGGDPQVIALDTENDLYEQVLSVANQLDPARKNRDEPKLLRLSEVRAVMNARGLEKIEGRPLVGTKFSDDAIGRLAALLRLENSRRLSVQAGVPAPSVSLLKSIIRTEALGLEADVKGTGLDFGGDAALEARVRSDYKLNFGEAIPQKVPVTVAQVLRLFANGVDISLSQSQLLSLASRVMAQGYRLRGDGYAASILRQMHRNLKSSANRPDDVPSLAEIFPHMAGEHPPWNLPGHLANQLHKLGQVPAYRQPTPGNHFRRGGQFDAGDGASPRPASTGDFGGVLRSSNTKFPEEVDQCLNATRGQRKSAQNWNQPMKATTAGTAGVIHCAGTWVKSGARNFTRMSTDAVTGLATCVAVYLTAKHCVEPGNLTSLSIGGFSNFLRVRVIPQTTASSRAGGDDAAAVMAEMSCDDASKLNYQSVATRGELEAAQGVSAGPDSPSQQTNLGIVIGLNDNINVNLATSRTGGALIGAAKLQPGTNFMSFNVDNERRNFGHPVQKGDSGSAVLACLPGQAQAKYVGALSSVYLNTPLAPGMLGEIASGGTLDWIHGTVFQEIGTAAAAARSLAHPSTLAVSTPNQHGRSGRGVIAPGLQPVSATVSQ